LHCDWNVRVVQTLTPHVIFLAFLFLTTVVYAVNYDIFDIGSYFLLSYIAIGWIAAYESISFNWINDKRSWMKVLAVVIVTVLPIVQVMNNWNGVDEAKNILRSSLYEMLFADRAQRSCNSESMDYLFHHHCIINSFEMNGAILPSSIKFTAKSLLVFMQFQRQFPELMERIRPSANLFWKNWISLNMISRLSSISFNLVGKSLERDSRKSSPIIQFISTHE